MRIIAQETKMGSIEVYDAKQAKWVPYVPDYEKWIQHFKDISEGRVRPDHKGRYALDSDVCGQYCIYFIMQRHLNRTMTDICGDFVKHEYNVNDTCVSHYVAQL